MSRKKAISLLVDHMHKSAKTPPKRGLARAHEASPQVAGFSLDYLNAFGYLKNELSQWQDIQLGDILEAVKQFQGMFGLKKTGQLCVRTVRAMQQPRCGCPDIDRPHIKGYSRLKGFVRANLARWRKTQLTYGIADYLPGISKTDFEQVVYNAFQAWCGLGGLSIQPTKTNAADIVISNGQGPQSNFDGPGGVLAWAYLPDGNDQQLLMKFDLDETWVLDPNQRGIALANVATHEFGHLCGLDHSKVQGALMAPYYNVAVSTPQENDDIPRFRARYGGTTQPTPPSGRSSTFVIDGSDYRITLNGKQVA